MSNNYIYFSIVLGNMSFINGIRTGDKMSKLIMFECSNCDPDHPCVAVRNSIVDQKTPTECPFNDTPEWMEVC